MFNILIFYILYVNTKLKSKVAVGQLDLLENVLKNVF